MAEADMERARLLASKMAPALAGEATEDIALAISLLTAHLVTTVCADSDIAHELLTVIRQDEDDFLRQYYDEGKQIG